MRKESFGDWINLEGVETTRTYHFPGGDTYTVDMPGRLFVKKSGSHKLVDNKGTMHYIRGSWLTFSAEGEWTFNIE